MALEICVRQFGRMGIEQRLFAAPAGAAVGEAA